MDRQERAALLRIDGGLRRDHELDAVLRRSGLGLRSRARDVVSGLRPRPVLLSGLLSPGLLVAGLRTSVAAVFWAFACCWALTPGIAFVVLCAGTEGRRSGR
ncbi:hypothetical protein [Streptomyces sp. CB01881]|uniref:hypothetical protein n=1 Tax=Streptomyces sp. CB01881 TaxID=2078691 RepID=UPI000CDBADD1|nr:hypothetical protein [Streptomyces sp. CB01881]AUY47796.1 hypothetical protein C2142_01065 [Streptomyces sp. CB01881]TYC76272.1 hypothetical protein EH183_01070 [Streptomyces sp. CB01881]